MQFKRALNSLCKPGCNPMCWVYRCVPGYRLFLRHKILQLPKSSFAAGKLLSVTQSYFDHCSFVEFVSQAWQETIIRRIDLRGLLMCLKIKYGVTGWDKYLVLDAFSWNYFHYMSYVSPAVTRIDFSWKIFYDQREDFFNVQCCTFPWNRVGSEESAMH